MEEFYQVVPIEGKGLGCVALKNIQIGTIILQEKPQCIPEDCANLPEDARSIPNVLQAFHRMSIVNQDNYLKLFNRFENYNDLNDQDKTKHTVWKQGIEDIFDIKQEMKE